MEKLDKINYNNFNIILYSFLIFSVITYNIYIVGNFFFFLIYKKHYLQNYKNMNLMINIINI
jgi:hypothetical protein